MNERLDEILRIALQYNVTDIHFSIGDLNSSEIKIEMRVHDEIKQLREKENDVRFFRYLMYRSNLDISNTIEPQTGRFEQTVDGHAISLRFSLVSSYHMTSGVLRILNNHSDISSMDLSLDPETTSWLKQITNHRDGMFIFSGPTGSGKTTTLYTILNETTGKKIFTLEDPVEVFNSNYVQLQINERQGFSYAEGIRQLMRHDPDIVMIGEIRDTTAAQMAMRCALTGHLVVTSLHSSSCISALHRMMDLGVEDYQLKDVVRGISNQRIYDMPDGRRTCIFEIMDRKEVNYYFDNKHTSQRFVRLEDRIRQALANGHISLEQAERDLN